MSIPLIFDLGMYDGADTQYYLSLGAKVIAVEANPVVVQNVQQQFRQPLDAGQLTIEAVAIGAEHGTVTLHLSADQRRLLLEFETESSGLDKTGLNSFIDALRKVREKMDR